MMDHYLNIDRLFLIPMFISMLVSLKAFRLAWPAAFRWFSVMLIVTNIGEHFALQWDIWLHGRFPKTNIWIYNIFLLIRYPLMAAYFHLILKSSTLKRLALWFILPVLGFGTVNHCFLQGPNAIPTYTFIPYNITLVLMCMFYFNQMLREKEIVRLERRSETWIAIGIFLYHSGSLPIFLMIQYLNSISFKGADSMMRINDVLNLIQYSCFIIAFLCKPQSRK